VKVFATFVLVLAALVPAHADTTHTWDVSANLTCSNPFDPCDAPFTLDATMTTQTETGLFYVEFQGEAEQGTYPVETGITGTFNGEAITYPGPIPAYEPLGIYSFLYLTGSFVVPNVPEGIVFEADGVGYQILYDGSIRIFPTDLPNDSSNPFNGEDVAWSAVDVTHVPEPAAVWLLLTALLLLASFAFRSSPRPAL
jgi:hypothetical protein